MITRDSKLMTLDTISVMTDIEFGDWLGNMVNEKLSRDMLLVYTISSYGKATDNAGKPLEIKSIATDIHVNFEDIMLFPNLSQETVFEGRKRLVKKVLKAIDWVIAEVQSEQETYNHTSLYIASVEFEIRSEILDGDKPFIVLNCGTSEC